MSYRGQMGQDKFLDKFVFQGLEQGVFIDVGAHDGESLSNTYFFEKEKGWKGICVEPIPTVFARCKEIRSNSVCYKVAIDREVGVKHFIQGTGGTEMLSVLSDHLDPRHYQRLQNDSMQEKKQLQSVEVQTKPLQMILDEQGITHVNYMSVDVEGAEFAVLDSVDFSKVTFDIIEVECNYDDFRPKYRDYFEQRGFVELLNLDWDILYIHTQSKYFKQFEGQTLPIQLSIFRDPWKNWKDL